MWNESNKIVDIIGLDETKTHLVHLIIRILGISERDILIVFDDSDYDDDFNPVWRNSQALHMNLAVGGAEEMSPKHLWDLMNKQTHAHFVWFSRKVSLSPPVGFTWVFSHEMQHVLQDIRSYTLSKASRFLHHTLGCIDIEEPKIDVTVPVDFDADRVAKRTVTEIFGEEECERYIDDQIRTGTRKQSFEILKQVNVEEAYDVAAETTRLLLKYQNELEDYQKTSDDTAITNFDIDNVCRKLEKVK